MSPSSTNAELAQARDEVRQLNLHLFELLDRRKALVARVQVLKERNQGNSFDPQRERELFLTLQSRLVRLSSREVLAFSLLMEAHAGAPEAYPAWSEGAHLLEAPSHIEHRMNPLLVKVLYPEAFLTLALSPDFSFLRSI